MIRVWVTRDESPDGPLGEALRNAGLQPIHEPVIERIKRGDAREELAQLGADDWLVLTSAFTIECLALDTINANSPPRIMAAGDATAQTARDRGFVVDDVAGYGAAATFDHLRQRTTHGTVCYPRSSLATPPKPWANVTIISPVVYETRQRDFDRSVLDRVHIAAMTSPSAVRAIGRVDLSLASIGPTTSAAIHEMGMTTVVEAAMPSFDALARAIADCDCLRLGRA